MSELKKSKVYTKTGDRGLTGLVGGQRVSKASLRIDLYGEVDELNSYLGIVRSLLKETGRQEYCYLEKLQVLLFDMGSNLASLEDDRVKFKLPQITTDHITEIEEQIDLIDSKLTPLKYFVLPGGTLAASHLHVCRTVARRVERKAISFNNDSTSDQELVGDSILKFLNRLSDYFFVLSRFENVINQSDEVCWIPEK